MESNIEQNGRLLQQIGQTNDRIHHDETSKVCLKRTSRKRKLSECDIKTQEHKHVVAMERNMLDPCKEKARWMEKKSESDDCSELSLQNMKAMNTKPLICPSRLKQFDYQQKFIIRSSVFGKSNIQGLLCRNRKERTVKQEPRHTNACGTRRHCHTKEVTKSLHNTKTDNSIQKLCSEVELLNLNVRRQSCNSYIEKSFIKGSKYGERLCLRTEDRLSPHVADVTVEDNVVANAGCNKQHSHTEVLSNLTPGIPDDTALEKSALSHHQDSPTLTQQELARITAVSHQTRNNHGGVTISADGQGNDEHVPDFSSATSDQSLTSDAHTYVAETFKECSVTSESVSSSAEIQMHFMLNNKNRVVYSPTRNDLLSELKGISLINCGSANLKDSELNDKLHTKYEPEHVKQQPVSEKRKHTGDNPCNSETSVNHLRSSGSLLQHMTKHSSADQYKCEYCDQCFSCKQQVVEDMTIHTGERPYKCDTSSECLKQKSTCRVPESGHTVEKRYKCEICGNCFRKKSHLNVHMRIHTGEKPYKCETCGMKFITSSKLTIHVRTHTGEKPYKCETCGRCFTQKGNLTCHTRIHTGEKPYYCEICGQSFASKSHLIHHMQRHHTEKNHNE